MRHIQDALRKNFPAKILAVIVALMLWGYVINEENPNSYQYYSVEVQVVNVPEGYTVRTDSKSIRVKVNGPRNSLASLTRDEISALVDATNCTEGTIELPVTVAVPKGFELAGVSAETMIVHIEQNGARGVPVEIGVTGSSGRDTSVGDIIRDTPYVNVYGPRSAVEQVVKVVGSVDLDGNTESFNTKVKLVPVDEKGNIVQDVKVAPAEIGVKIQIVPGASKKIVGIRANVTGTPASHFTVGNTVVNPAKVELRGKEDALAQLSSIDTEAISVQGVNRTFKQDVNLVLPKGVYATVKKVTVEVNINAEQQK